MKKLRYLFFAATLIVSAVSCNKANEHEDCGNKKRDNDETEIDCGGDCDPCPSSPTFFAKINGHNYVASEFLVDENGGAITIYTQGTGTVEAQFTFVGKQLNTALPITHAMFLGEQYFHNYSIQDTGRVVLTAHDELRKIISGRVSYSATNEITSDPGTLTEGIFENVRYGN